MMWVMKLWFQYGQFVLEDKVGHGTVRAEFWVEVDYRVVVRLTLVLGSRFWLGLELELGSRFGLGLG